MPCCTAAGNCGSESCNMAFAAHPDDLYFKVQAARWMPYEQKTEALRLWREAAAQGSAEAYYEIYEHHRSWDRGHLDKVPHGDPRRSRRGAAQGGRTRASLCHADAGTACSTDGDIVKRDPVAARYWAERAVANPRRTPARQPVGDARTLAGDL